MLHNVRSILLCSSFGGQRTSSTLPFTAFHFRIWSALQHFPCFLDVSIKKGIKYN